MLKTLMQVREELVSRMYLRKQEAVGSSGHRQAARSLDSLLTGLGGQVGYVNAVGDKWVDG